MASCRADGIIEGSSPLARGLPAESPQNMRYLRIIPARAGFTGRRRQRRASATDHPRSRGVYPTPGRFECDRSGSSPLARGLLDSFAYADTDSRIIPARAGFTISRRVTVHQESDHPRSRGVYEEDLFAWRFELGSSPLARGLREHRIHAALELGIIPARAGFTRRTSFSWSSATDHPRSRGVYEPIAIETLGFCGSSPLARGLRIATLRSSA